MHQLDEKLARRAEEERRRGAAPATERAGRLHIALVTETYPPELNGVSLSVCRIVDYLRERGHAVEVVRPRQPADDAPNAPNAGKEEFLLRGMTLPLYP